ncbi:MAG: hypothetical protein ACR2PZ_02090 [Pseudomonadales bacterium]
MLSLIANWLRLPWRQGAGTPVTAPAKRAKAQYGAVEIEPGLEGGCGEVTKREGNRYLMSEAPSLPLTGCDAESCNCRYVRLDDRRQDARRDADLGIEHRGVLAEERRAERRGRRHTDRR